MRNIFDQYRHPENRLTHALVCVLGNEPAVLRRFIQWVTGQKAPSPLSILEQQLPGEEEAADEDEAERRGLPDAWIHNGKEWALIVESKISAPLNRDQLERHRRVAQRRGFTEIVLLAIVTQRLGNMAIGDVKVVEWRELYKWCRRQTDSPWCARLTGFMEVLEQRLVAQEYLREGTLTVFAGIPFGSTNPYNYGEGKRLLKLAFDALRQRTDLRNELGADPTRHGRSAITGRQGTFVWDFIPLRQARSAKVFTEYPHLTLSIEHDRLMAIVIVPNGIRREFRRKLLAGGKQPFLELFKVIHDNIEECMADIEGAVPWVGVVQRHYPSQRSEPVIDAELQFDLRTAFQTGTARRSKNSAKRQPQWLDVLYEVLSDKRSNLQLAVGVVFPYSRCPAVSSPQILDRVADAWRSCKPILNVSVRTNGTKSGERAS